MAYPEVIVLNAVSNEVLEDLIVQQTQVGYGPALRMLKREASRRHQEALKKRRYNRATIPMYRN